MKKFILMNRQYKNIKVLNLAIEKYMDSYNKKRLHSALDSKGEKQPLIFP